MPRGVSSTPREFHSRAAEPHQVSISLPPPQPITKILLETPRQYALRSTATPLAITTAFNLRASTSTQQGKAGITTSETNSIEQAEKQPRATQRSDIIGIVKVENSRERQEYRDEGIRDVKGKGKVVQRRTSPLPHPQPRRFRKKAEHERAEGLAKTHSSKSDTFEKAESGRAEVPEVELDDEDKGVTLGSEEEDDIAPSRASPRPIKKLRLVYDKQREGSLVYRFGRQFGEQDKENAIPIEDLLKGEVFTDMPGVETGVVPRRRVGRPTGSGAVKTNGVSSSNAISANSKIDISRSLGGRPSSSKGQMQVQVLITGSMNGGSTTTVSSEVKTKVPPKALTSGQFYHAKPSNPHEKKIDESGERNIDNVIFGDITFKAWYPSWYPASIIGEKALSDTKKECGIVVSELYVCNRCFGYSKTLVEWVRHCRCCEKGVPGRRVYVHAEPGTVAEEGDEARWSIWEVDGGVEALFCQNLSLFAKLFLDNKSVFFDVSGFNYFLLVHTSTPTASSPPISQIIGFFSKEKMSWDNNNLACILVFPPWQRKGLGSLLMGISYAIARREGILGGPEKPISDLGKKGYKRFWGAEVARWLLQRRESDRKKGRGYVDVSAVSKGTWILPEDCLSVMRDMGVVERAGKGKGSVERVKIDKEAIRTWVERERVDLRRVVGESGFEEGYAVREDEEVEEDIELE